MNKKHPKPKSKDPKPTHQKSNEGVFMGNQDGGKPADPDNKDGNKEAFSQACQMYRHFVTMKYYIIAGFGVAMAAIATLYFIQLPATSNAHNAGNWIRLCAVMVALACGAYDWRITSVMYHYQKLIGHFAASLGVSAFSDHPRTTTWMLPLRVATILIYGGVVVAWAFFATMPPIPHK